MIQYKPSPNSNHFIVLDQYKSLLKNPMQATKQKEVLNVNLSVIYRHRAMSILQGLNGHDALIKKFYGHNYNA